MFKFNIKNPNRALIEFHSVSLGDTIAWMPYVNEFQKQFKSTTFVACAWHDLFDYPNLVYIPNQGTKDEWRYQWPSNHDVGYRHKMSLGGIHHPIVQSTLDKSFENPLGRDGSPPVRNGKPISLQACGARQIHMYDLEKIEIRPKIKPITTPRQIQEKYVCIGVQASKNPQKYWNNPNGWQEVVDYLIDELGYKVVCIDKLPPYNYNGVSYDTPKRVLNKTGNFSIEDRMIDLKYADFFIGVSSGLAWLSWAVKTHVFMINGFTFPENEFQSGCTHIYNNTVCTGCYSLGVGGGFKGISYFNGTEFKFRRDASNNCPIHEYNPNKHFECTSSISSKMVLAAIKAYI